MRAYAVAYSIVSQVARDSIGRGSRNVTADSPEDAYSIAYRAIRAEVDAYAPRALITIMAIVAASEYAHGGSRHLCNTLSPCHERAPIG